LAAQNDQLSLFSVPCPMFKNKWDTPKNNKIVFNEATRFGFLKEFLSFPYSPQVFA